MDSPCNAPANLFINDPILQVNLLNIVATLRVSEARKETLGVPKENFLMSNTSRAIECLNEMEAREKPRFSLEALGQEIHELTPGLKQ